MEAEVDAKGRADEALPQGSRIHVAGHGAGSYVSFSRSRIGANQHTVQFDRGGTVVVR